jgi:hypothetical protein
MIDKFIKMEGISAMRGLKIEHLSSPKYADEFQCYQLKDKADSC